MSHDTEQLAALIRYKHQVLTHLLATAGRQLALIESGDWTALMKELSMKSRLVDALGDVESRLNPYRSENPDGRAWQDSGLHDECRRLSGECGELLASVVRIENQSESLLARRRDEARARLQGMHSSAVARAAYADSSDGSALMPNLTSDFA
jgi:hypothetical protein